MAAAGRVIEQLFEAPLRFAPADAFVRRRLEILGEAGGVLLSCDLPPLLDVEGLAPRPRHEPRDVAAIGILNGAARESWPADVETFRALYPRRADRSRFAFGAPPDEVRPWLGPDWCVLPEDRQDILQRLDVGILLGGGMAPSFDRRVAGALAAGVPLLLDPAFEPVFGEAALYPRPDEAAPLLERLLGSPGERQERAEAARRAMEARYGIASFPGRMRQLCAALDIPAFEALDTGPSRAEGAAPPARPPPARRERRVLFVATNGQGLGHVTRLMAIAERLAPGFTPIFFTRSAGSALIRERGLAADYIPWTVPRGVSDQSWNKAYAQELLTAIDMLRISGVVFDGTYPFAGLLEIQEARPDLAWVWVRRGLWVPGQQLRPQLQQRFDVILEPAELAGSEDRGPTSTQPEGVHPVPTILLSDPRRLLPRDEAARRLGTDPGRFTVAVQLGSRRNFDYEDLPELIAAEVLGRGLQLVRLRNPLAPPQAPREGAVDCSLYPLAECLGAIDLMVCNAGYNGFHELIYAGVPAVFVPNEAPEMDDQHLRAAYAEAAGLGLRLRASEPGRVREVLDQALSEPFRQGVARRAARLPFVNGAAQAARIIEDLLLALRTDRPLQEALPRL